MTDAPTAPPTACDGCATELADGVLACPGCHRLVHGPRLEVLARDASDAEARGDLLAATTTWRTALELLPPTSTQHAAIVAKVQRLRGELNVTEKAKASNGRTGLAAIVAVAAAALVKAKWLFAALLKAPTLLSMALFVAAGDRGLVGLGVVLTIYVHEMGHVAAFQRVGIPTSPPMFVPGLGAFVRGRHLPADAHEDAEIALAGPLFGFCATLPFLAWAAATRSHTAAQIAYYGAFLNLLNLLPFWVLDGKHAFRALDAAQRFAIAGGALVFCVATRSASAAAIGVLALVEAFAARGAKPTPPRDWSIFARFVGAYVALWLVCVGALSLGAVR